MEPARSPNPTIGGLRPPSTFARQRKEKLMCVRKTAVRPLSGTVKVRGDCSHSLKHTAGIVAKGLAGPIFTMRLRSTYAPVGNPQTVRSNCHRGETQPPSWLTSAVLVNQ